MNITNVLKKEANLDYKKFQEKICQTKYPILGVKIPTLRKIAKNLLKTTEVSKIMELNNDYYETVMLKGLVIGLSKVSYEEKITLINSFLPLIDNWAICDVFCSSLKFIKDNQDKFLPYLEKLSQSNKEYYLRFVIVIYLNYYLDDTYIDYVLNKLLTIKSDKYYVLMAISWAYSISFIKYFNKTKEFFIKYQNDIPKWVYNKSIQKSLESYQISKENKNILKSMKKPYLRTVF